MAAPAHRCLRRSFRVSRNYGAIDVYKVHMRLQRVDRDKLLLVNRGFHWIQEYPPNR
jgi:hypothetical protein